MADAAACVLGQDCLCCEVPANVRCDACTRARCAFGQPKHGRPAIGRIKSNTVRLPRESPNDGISP